MSQVSREICEPETVEFSMCPEFKQALNKSLEADIEEKIEKRANSEDGEDIYLRFAVEACKDPCEGWTSDKTIFEILDGGAESLGYTPVEFALAFFPELKNEIDLESLSNIAKGSSATNLVARQEFYRDIIESLMSIVDERIRLEEQAQLIEEEIGRKSLLRFEHNPEMYIAKAGELIKHRSDLTERIVATIESANSVLDQIDDPEMLASIKQIYAYYLKVMYPPEERPSVTRAFT